MLTPQAKQRAKLLEQMGLAHGTLRAAVSDINIGESIPGCEEPVGRSREIALGRINAIRTALTTLEELVKP